MSDQLPALATPAEVAEYLHTTTAALAQDRYLGGRAPSSSSAAAGFCTAGPMSWNGWTKTPSNAQTIRDNSDE
jgi:hypothetical protein